MKYGEHGVYNSENKESLNLYSEQFPMTFYVKEATEST